MNTSKVDRVEVINWTKETGCREYVFWNRDKEKEVDVEIQLQDDNRTLKVFIKNHDTI